MAGARLSHKAQPIAPYVGALECALHWIGDSMPIGYIRAMLAKAEYEYLAARRGVRAGLVGNACLARAKRDMLWQAYREAKSRSL